MTRHDSPLAPEQIAAVTDNEIDFSDIPELDEDFWQNAELIQPDRTEQVTLRIKASVLAHFKASGKGYQTRINQVLEKYVRSLHKLHPPDWLIGGDWKGHPDDAMMRVDERGVAVRLAATYQIRRSGAVKREMSVDCPFHINAQQVWSERLQGTTYHLDAMDGASYTATRGRGGAVRVVVGDREWVFHAGAPRASLVETAKQDVP